MILRSKDLHSLAVSASALLVVVAAMVSASAAGAASNPGLPPAAASDPAHPTALPTTTAPPDDYDYAAVDAWAAAAPPDSEGSIQSLAAYLARGAKNQRERARAIFDWIATKVAYDYDGLAARTCDPLPAHVLTSRIAECVGNSQLFTALAKAAGLNAITILGVSRAPWWDPAYQVSAGHTSPTHAWNAVQIDGQWRLLDVTNSQTAKKLNGQFQKEQDFDPEWFLTPADEFIYTHLPDDPAWQLGAHAAPPDADSTMPYLRPSFFRYGLKLVGEGHPEIRCQNYLDMRVEGPPTDSLFAELSPLGKAPLEAGHTLVERDGGKFRIAVLFPAAGTYGLRIFAHHVGERIFKDIVAEWRVNAASGDPTAHFPTLCGAFSDTGAFLYGPFSRTLAAGTPQAFQIKVPGALQVGIITGGQILPLKGQGDVYSGLATPVPGDLQIAAEFPDHPGAFAGLVIYQVPGG